MTLVSTRRARGLAAPSRDSGSSGGKRSGLEVDGLTVSFGGARAVRGVSFAVEPGETLVVLGESGSGKSVTARALLRLHGASASVSGRVLLDGVDLLGLDERAMRARRGREVAFVPQDAAASLDPLRRVGAQLVEVLRVHRVATDRASAAARAEECLRQVGLADPRRVARSFPHELSGGMRQRVLIALAVSCRPRVLVADEPTTALDVTIQAQVLDLFAELQAASAMSLVMVTHDVGVARRVADKVAVMYAGRIVEDGPAGEVLDRPAHHYTAGLLGAVPAPGIPRGSLVAIAGRPPTVAEISDEACGFAPRCPAVTDACRAALPPLARLGDRRRSACPPMAATFCGDQEAK